MSFESEWGGVKASTSAQDAGTCSVRLAWGVTRHSKQGAVAYAEYGQALGGWVFITYK